MNIQALMKQAQNMQKDMLKAKDEIDKKIYEGNNSFVHVKANGKKEIIEINIDSDKLEKEDIEMLQDILIVAINGVFKQIDKETEEKMGKFTNSMPGLF